MAARIKYRFTLGSSTLTVTITSYVWKIPMIPFLNKQVFRYSPLCYPLMRPQIQLLSLRNNLVLGKISLQMRWYLIRSWPQYRSRYSSVLIPSRMSIKPMVSSFAAILPCLLTTFLNRVLCRPRSTKLGPQHEPAKPASKRINTTR